MKEAQLACLLHGLTSGYADGNPALPAPNAAPLLPLHGHSQRGTTFSGAPKSHDNEFACSQSLPSP